MVRCGIRQLLESQGRSTVVGEAKGGLEAVRLCEKLHPDVLILDLILPNLARMDALRIIRRCSPRARVVVFSMLSDIPIVAATLRLGATSFAPKSSAERDLIRAVDESVAGQRYIGRPINAIALNAYMEQVRSGPLDPHEALIEREREVLKLVAEGETNRAIAWRLYISPRTVESHRANVMRKLGLKNRTELVRHALRHGLIPQ